MGGTELKVVVVGVFCMGGQSNRANRSVKSIKLVKEVSQKSVKAIRQNQLSVSQIFQSVKICQPVHPCMPLFHPRSPTRPHTLLKGGDDGSGGDRGGGDSVGSGGDGGGRCSWLTNS